MRYQRFRTSLTAPIFSALLFIACTGERRGLWESAERNGRQAGQALRQCQAFLYGWLARVDPTTDLIPRNLTNSRDYWNAQDAAADNYPFMVLTAAFTDPDLFTGRLLRMLQTEERLTSRLGALPDDYSFTTGGFRFEDADLDRMIFGGSEYVKDGLMPLTEWLGSSPWSERMLRITEAIWEHAPVEVEGGTIPSVSPEVNGEMMQVAGRLYWMTGREEYLDRACRLADWYLLGDRHPTLHSDQLRLRDHGCELISGLSEVYLACAFSRPEKADQYRHPIHVMLDRILEVGCNEHGLMYNRVNPLTGEILDERLSDNFGYNYNAFYTVFLIDGDESYRQAVRTALDHLDEHYRDYPWEGESHDGYADALEGAINLINRETVPSAERWIDSEMERMLAMQQPDGIIGGWHGDGNFARTALMYALWKSRGTSLQPWREDVRTGATWKDGELYLVVSAERPWSGRVVFDTVRHRTVLNLPVDYPRINQFPEWFTAEAAGEYRITGKGSPSRIVSGTELLNGLPLSLEAAGTYRWIIRRLDTDSR